MSARAVNALAAMFAFTLFVIMPTYIITTFNADDRHRFMMWAIVPIVIIAILAFLTAWELRTRNRQPDKE